MNTKLKAWWHRTWHEPNPEGFTGLDALCMTVIPIAMFLILVNLMLWLARPEQAWIGKLLFPMK